MSGEDEAAGFLSRWSRRKRAAAAEPVPPETAPQSEPEPEPEPVPEPAGPSAALRPACPIPNLPAIDPASLPSIDALTAESDFAAFLRPGVPPLLRHSALRRMWSLDTGIRDYIGPVEYQWDFNTPGGLPHGFASELGGDLRKLLAQAIGERDELAEPTEAPAIAEEPASAEPSEPLAEVLMADSPEAAPAADQPAEPPDPPRRRHGGALPA